MKSTKPKERVYPVLKTSEVRVCGYCHIIIPKARYITIPTSEGEIDLCYSSRDDDSCYHFFRKLQIAKEEMTKILKATCGSPICVDEINRIHSFQQAKKVAIVLIKKLKLTINHLKTIATNALETIKKALNYLAEIFRLKEAREILFLLSS